MQDPSFFRQAATAASLVTQLTILVILGTWVGAKLDVWLHTGPWLLLLGCCSGVAAGLAVMILGFNRMQTDDEHDSNHPS
jgi:F0F1-type ATP synthase assembly protein I